MILRDRKVKVCFVDFTDLAVFENGKSMFLRIENDDGTVKHTYGVLGDPGSSKNQIPRRDDRGGKNGSDRNSGNEKNCKGVPGRAVR